MPGCVGIVRLAPLSGCVRLQHLQADNCPLLVGLEVRGGGLSHTTDHGKQTNSNQ